MAVVTVWAGIVSSFFPENGKSTGNFSTSRRYATALPYVTTCIYCDYCAHRESGAIFSRELSGNTHKHSFGKFDSHIKLRMRQGQVILACTALARPRNRVHRQSKLQRNRDAIGLWLIPDRRGISPLLDCIGKPLGGIQTQRNSVQKRVARRWNL